MPVNYSIAEGKGDEKRKETYPIWVRRGGSKMGKEVINNIDELEQGIVRISKKYMALVERRIDGADELTGENLRDIYDGIQMLGHIVATMERFSRMEQCEPNG